MGYKAGVAKAVVAMASIIGKDFSNTKIVPVICNLLDDQNSDVKLSAVKGVAKLANTIGKEVLTANNGAIKKQMFNATKDGQWRCRMEVFEVLADLALNGNVDQAVFKQ